MSADEVLSGAARRLAPLLGVFTTPVSRSVFCRVAASLGFRSDRGKSYSVRTVLPVFEEFERVGLLEAHPDHQYAAAPPYADGLLAVLAESADLDAVLETLEVVLPLPASFFSSYGKVGEKASARARLHARVALLAGDTELVEMLHEALADVATEHRAAAPPKGLAELVDGCDPDLLYMMPIETLETVLAAAVEQSVYLGRPCDELLEVVLEASGGGLSGGGLPALAANAGLALLAQGDAARALEVIDGCLAALLGGDEDEAQLLAVRGSALWVLEDDRAAACFAKMRKSSKKARQSELPTRRPAPSGPAGVFCALSFLTAGGTEGRKAAAKIRAMPEDGIWQFRRAHELLLAVADGEGVVGPRIADLERLLTGAEVSPWLLLAAGLAARWSGCALPEAVDELLRQEAKRCAEAGYEWLGAQLLSVAASPKGKRRSRASAKKARDLGLLVTRFERPEPWREALAALEALVDEGPAGKSAAATADSRFVFELDPKRRFNVSVYIQKLNKKGWTGGRKASLETLSRKTPSYATREDRDVLCHIGSETSGYGRYVDTYYFFDEGVHGALVGHPRVTLEGARQRFVNVVEAAPTLEVARAGKGLRLQVSGGASLEATVTLEPSGEVAVRSLSPAQFELASTLREHPVVFPESAKDRLGVVLASLAPIIDVQGDRLGSTVAAAEVSPETRPRLRLKREESGLAAKLRVLPLGDGTPARVPGEGAGTLLGVRDGRSVQTHRDMAAELDRASAVVRACPTLEPSEPLAQGWHLPTLEESLDLLGELRELGDDVQLEWPEGDKMRVTPVRSSNLSVRMTARKNWLEPRGDVKVDGERVVEMKMLLAALAAAPSRYVRLDDGSFLALERVLAKELARVAAFAMPSPSGAKGVLRLHPLSALAMESLDAAVGVGGNAAFVTRLDAAKDARRRPAKLPRGLKAELRPYQLEGFRWLARLGDLGASACLADDMGLGKTVQALALLLHRASLGPALVSAPTSVCHGWLEEAARFAPSLRMHTLRGSARTDELGTLGAFDVVLCSHGLLARELERLRAVRFGTFVLDEAQVIKNPATVRAKAVFALDADMRVATTGTPIENHLGELHSLFRFLEPTLLGGDREFRSRFRDPIEQGDKQARGALRDRILPFILRRRKSQVLDDLPSRTDILVRVEAGPEQRAFYEAVRERALEELAAGETAGTSEGSSGQQRMQIFAALTRLRQACCHPRLVSPAAEIPSAKMDAFLELVDELRGGEHRALVFSQFVRHLALVREQLDARDIRYQYLDGGTPAKKRAERVRAFQAGEGDVFLISLKAGGTGLNLTGADYVVHLDPWWNPAVEDQATDRAHRIGQTRPVTAYRIIMADTIEEQIVELHRAKRDLAEQLLSGTDKAAKLSVDDMLELLRG